MERCQFGTRERFQFGGERFQFGTRRKFQFGTSEKFQFAYNQSIYRLGTVNSNTVNSKFHLIQSFFEIFATFLSFHV